MNVAPTASQHPRRPPGPAGRGRGPGRPGPGAGPGAGHDRAARRRAAGPPHHRACLQGRRQAGHAPCSPTTQRRWRASSTRRTRRSTTRSAWLFDGMAAAFRGGAARLAIGGEDPSLLSGQDPDRVARANRARSVAYRPALELITNFAINWNIVCYATPVLGAHGVPRPAGGRGGGPAVGRDLRRLARRRARPGRRLGRAQCGAARPHRLAERQALRGAAFPRARHRPARRPGRRASLARRVGAGEERHRLQPQHPDRGGVHHAAPAAGGRHGAQHEAALLPGHADRGHRGALRGRRDRRATARTGQEVLEKVLGTDEGARRLGEVALVPHSSPISASGLLFFNTLFDENAASHIALGQAYRTCLEGGTTRRDAELARAAPTPA